jgi:hypothetical protein
VVSSNRYKNTRRTVMKNPKLPIKIVNRYEALRNTQKRTSATQYPGLIKSSEIITKKRKSLQKKKRKIVAIGDSFSRGIASELLHNLGSAFEVIGCVKPGSGLEVINRHGQKGDHHTDKGRYDRYLRWN